MKSEFFLLLILFTLGCGQAPSPTPVTVDPQLQPYFQAFENDIGVSTAGISAQFATPQLTSPLGEVIGECQIWSDGTRLIQIDPGFWATTSQLGRMQILVHELGHCAMYMQHITSLLTTGCPTSIMYPIFFGDTPCYDNNEGYYFQELASHK